MAFAQPLWFFTETRNVVGGCVSLYVRESVWTYLGKIKVKLNFKHNYMTQNLPYNLVELMSPLKAH